jgi:transcription initiation factor IIE alpha subunit
MQLHEYWTKLSSIRAFATPVRCPHCDELMVAPTASEFIEGGEIRHHWECDACGEGLQYLDLTDARLSTGHAAISGIGDTVRCLHLGAKKHSQEELI